MTDDDDVKAYVEVIDGQVVLHDPMAEAMFHAIERISCKETAKAQKDRLIHFARRAIIRGIPKQEALITLINVDSLWGRNLAEALMPGHDWQEYRDRGEIPFARGLAVRAPIQELLDDTFPFEGSILRSINGCAILVVDYDTVAVFTFDDLLS